MNERRDIFDPGRGGVAVGSSEPIVSAKSRWHHWTDAAAWALISIGLILAHHIVGLG